MNIERTDTQELISNQIHQNYVLTIIDMLTVWLFDWHEYKYCYKVLFYMIPCLFCNYIIPTDSPYPRTHNLSLIALRKLVHGKTTCIYINIYMSGKFNFKPFGQWKWVSFKNGNILIGYIDKTYGYIYKPEIALV